ncbi:hypothetical protein P43SY_004739 [Pythium insidiosum]|uniref:Transmembrane protein n=1 Tax=Pythium insidiosum TaxID=114742 RepID=A0AAD5LXN6_PYTIN|nr:hypothetical protein P43SY_004739 [Pythium insidiosum]
MGAAASTSRRSDTSRQSGASRHRRSSVSWRRSLRVSTRVHPDTGDSALYHSKRSVRSANESVLAALPARGDAAGDFDDTASDRTRRTFARESTVASSNRSLFGGMQRKLSSSSVSGRPSMVSTELRDELLLVKRNLFSRKPWKDGLHVMWIVVANTITSIVVAWVVTLLFSIGSPFRPQRSGMLASAAATTDAAISPAAHRHFYGAVGSYFVSFACLGHLVTKSYQHSERLVSFNTSMRRHSFRSTLRQYLTKTTHVLLMSIAMGSGIMIGLHEAHVPFREAGRFHILLLCFCPTVLTFKIMLQEATKRFQLHAGTRMPSARAVHMTMTIPTVAVDAQIRMAFVQLGGAGQSSPITSSLVIVFGKILFRLAKILRLRSMIKGRLDKSKGMKRIIKRVNSKIALKDVAAARAEYSRFLDWRNYMLKLHAAEVYADMHGEYISIGLSMAVITLLSNHEMYTITRNESISRQVFAAAVQMAIGLAFDYISSVVEGVHEVPLYESIDDEGHGLRIFIHVLLGSLTAINAGVIAAFALRSDVRAHP